jgi:hypothetical protein
MVSLDVSIFRPVLVVAVNAACAMRVRPVHVTVVAPATRVAASARVIVMTLVVYAEVVEVVGEEIPHMLLLCALTTLFGNVRVILLVPTAAVKGVEVVNMMVAVPVVPTAALKDMRACLTQFVHDAVSGDCAAAKGC